MKTKKLLIALLALSMTSCTLEAKSEEIVSINKSELQSESQVQSEDVSIEESVEPSVDTSEQSTSEDQPSEEPSSEEIVISEEDSSEEIDETAVKIAALKQLAGQLDQNPNFTLNVEISENGGVVEKDKCEVNGSEYLFTDITNSERPVYTYHKLEEDGMVNKWRELVQGTGDYKNLREFYSNTVFDTGYFIAFGKYDAINYTLSALLDNYAESMSEQTYNEENVLFIDSVNFALNLEFAAQYYSKSELYKFTSFKSASYNDWTVSNFTILVTMENNEIQSFKIEYDCNVLMTSAGSSGIIDFILDTDWQQHKCMIFDNFGTTTVNKPAELQ